MEKNTNQMFEGGALFAMQRLDGIAKFANSSSVIQAKMIPTYGTFKRNNQGFPTLLQSQRYSKSLVFISNMKMH